MTYREQLNLANKLGISATDLMIAEEVETMAVYPTEEEFEEVCALISDTYFAIDSYFDLHKCCVMITELHAKIDLKELWEMTAWERADTYEDEFEEEE